jgi:4-hydroxybenzoate polyprenyltransferase
LRALLQSLRPQQWVKNAFVVAPLVFSSNLTDPALVLRTLAATVAFCLLSGAVYLINDIFDVEKDRTHPTKRHRPIAAGQLSLRRARLAATVILMVALGSAFALDWRLGLVALVYFVQNILYSWKIKHVVFLDVGSIAFGFLLRTLAGAFAIDVSFSIWLFGCTFLLALYLGLGKRKHEVLQAGSGRGKQRRVLEYYQPESLNYALLMCAGMTIAAYTAYTMSISLPGQPWHPVRSPFESPWLPATIPFAVIGIIRFYFLVSRADQSDSPTDRMIRDPVFVGNVLLWGAAILVLIYL